MLWIYTEIWWLVLGIFLIAIIERGNLMNEEKPWFNMFALIFELVSAFGGIGLSLGFPGVRTSPYDMDSPSRSHV